MAMIGSPPARDSMEWTGRRWRPLAASAWSAAAISATRPTLASPTVRRRSSLCSGLTQGDIISAQCDQGDSRLPFMRVYDAIRSKLCPLQVPGLLICKLSKRSRKIWYPVPVIARQPGQPALLRAHRRLKDDVEARPQRIVWIGELDGPFGRLRGRVELVGAGDETALVRILVAGRQNKAEFTALGNLLDAWECFAALKIHGGRRLADHMDRIQLDNGGEATLIARLLGDVRAFSDEGLTDDAGDRRVKLSLLQSQFAELHVGARFVGPAGRQVALCLGFQQLHFRGNIATPQRPRVLQLHLGETQLRLRLSCACLGKRNGEFLVPLPELEQNVALLYKLAGREVDLEQKPIEPGSHYRFARSSHRAFVFEDFGRGRLLAQDRMDCQAKHCVGRDSPRTAQSREESRNCGHCSLLFQFSPSFFSACGRPRRSRAAACATARRAGRRFRPR